MYYVCTLPSQSLSLQHMHVCAHHQIFSYYFIQIWLLCSLSD